MCRSQGRLTESKGRVEKLELTGVILIPPKAGEESPYESKRFFGRYASSE
jgi:hypothetical protein